MKPPTRLLNLLLEQYPDPREYDTADSFARYHHDDLRSLTDEELEDERFLARLRRACEPNPSEWLRQRIAHLDAEATRRHRPAGVR